MPDRTTSVTHGGPAIKLAFVVAMLMASSAGAQTTDVVVMRRAVAPPRIEMAPSHQAGTWNEGAWTFASNAPSCSDGAPQVRMVSCQANGVTIDDGKCAGTKPGTTQKVQRYEGCNIGWATGDYSNWNPTCGKNASRSRSVQCMRTGGDSAPHQLDDSACDGTKPAISDTGEAAGGCGYQWNTATGACSGDGQRAQTVTCLRSDGETVTTGCNASTKPVDTITDSSCAYAYAWNSGQWSTPPAASCGAIQTSYRTVTCKRSDGVAAPDASCTDTKPSETQEVPNYSSCTTNYSCGSWTSNQQSSGTNYLLYDAYTNLNASDRKTLANRLCQDVTKAKNINVCTETVISEPGGNRLKVFGTNGRTISQATPGVIDATRTITESSTSACTVVP